MNVCILGMMVTILCFLLLLTGSANAKAYDYSAINECLPEPVAPQYKGGIVKNPTFDSNLDGWTVYNGGQIVQKVSDSGNKFVVSYNRTHQSDSVSQIFSLKKNILYTFSAWVRIGNGTDNVLAVIKVPDERKIIVGTAIAKPDCWSFLKGGFQVDEDMDALIYFKSDSKNVTADLWIDNVSLKPFSETKWREQQRKTIEKVRMKEVRIHVTDVNGKVIEGAEIDLKETRPGFLIGCSSTEAILTHKGYQDWFTARFPITTFNNEMKWYVTEYHKGVENYTVADAMVAFFEQHGIAIRGHNILWNSVYRIPWYVNNTLPRERTLPHRAIFNAAVKHMAAVVSRYVGRVIAWDVVNENMHYDFFEREIGPYASAMFYQIAHAMDPETLLFLNEFNVVEYPGDLPVSPPAYVEEIKKIRSYPGNENLTIGIGLQGHFANRPNVSSIRSSLDVLGSTKMPIWFTELDARSGPDQGVWVENVMREAFSHPAVEGIIVWGGWKPGGACRAACVGDGNRTRDGCGGGTCLMDDNYKTTPLGELVDNLIKEWKTTDVKGFTDKDGNFTSRLFKGEYSLTITRPQSPNTLKQEISVLGESKGALELSVLVQ